MKVLCVDGGGIRGLIPALVLAEIEDRCGRPAAELFDLIAGTSTGGIIACGLTAPGEGGRPRHTARQVAEIYVEEGPRIFHASLLKTILSLHGIVDERYDDDGLMGALRRNLGDARLSEALTRVFIPAYDIEQRTPFYFRSWAARADPGGDYTMVEAARATAAAPTYFEPAVVRDAGPGRPRALIDGGVVAVNPTMAAYAQLIELAWHTDLTLVASLGTGAPRHMHPYDVDEVRGWGQLQWARPIIDVVFDGVSDVTDFEARHVLGAAYVRLQAALEGASQDLDDASERNLAALRRVAERLIRERSADIDRLCAVLTG